MKKGDKRGNKKLDKKVVERSDKKRSKKAPNTAIKKKTKDPKNWREKEMGPKTCQNETDKKGKKAIKKRQKTGQN